MSQSDKKLEEIMELMRSMTAEHGEEAFGPLVDILKSVAMAQRTVAAMEQADFAMVPSHPNRLSKNEVIVNPPAFEAVNRAAGLIHNEVDGEPFVIVENIFEFISMADGSLRVVYPMLAKPTELDLDAEVAQLQWVGDVVAGCIDPADWFPVTTIGDLTILTDPSGGSYEA